MARPFIPESIRLSVLEKSKYRCGYCLAPQELLYSKLRIDHVIPVALEGSSDEHNLSASCDPCNGHKSDKTHAADPMTGALVPLFNPIVQIWSEHFTFAEDQASIIGLTAIGRVTIDVLQMNDALVLALRRRWVSVGWYPPK